MRPFALAILVALGLSVAVPVIAQADEAPGYQIQTGEEQGGRSGFWTNRAPAKGGAYRWRLLGIGVCLACVTAAGMIVLIRRANAERARRQ